MLKDYKICPCFIKLQNTPLSINPTVLVGKLRQGISVPMRDSKGNGVWIVERSGLLPALCVQSGRPNYYSVQQWCENLPEKE